MRWLLACALALCLATPGLAAERLDLTAPLTPSAPATPPSIDWWRVAGLHFLWDEARIVAEIIGSNGERRECKVEGPAALTLMIALNKANLTSNSLHRRTLNHFASAGCLTAGTVSGSPD